MKDSAQPVRVRIPVNPQGRFTVSKLLPCETLLEAGGKAVRVRLDRPETQVSIDLTEQRPSPKQRRVILRVVARRRGESTHGWG